MFVSAEMITMIAMFASLLATLGAGFGWIIHRFDSAEKKADARFDSFERRIDVRFDSSEAKTDARFDSFERRTDARFDSLENRIDALSRDLTDVKVSVARLEGVPRHLQVAR